MFEEILNIVLQSNIAHIIICNAYFCLNIGHFDNKQTVHQEERTLKISFGAGREKNTVVAVCSDSGIALDQLVIFDGKSMQSSWIGEQALPNTYYRKSGNVKLPNTYYRKSGNVKILHTTYI